MGLFGQIRRTRTRHLWVYALALQLHFRFDMSASSGGLMRSSPARPSDDVGGLDTTLGKLVGDPPDFLDRPADQVLMVGILGLFGGVVSLAR